MSKIKLEWIILFLVLIFSYLALFTPVGIITSFLLMVPIIILFVRTSIIMFFSQYVLVNIILFIIPGITGLILVVFSLFLLIPSLVIGVAIKKSLPASKIISRGTISLIALTLTVLMIIYLNGFNIFDSFKLFLSNYYDSLPNQLKIIVSNNQKDKFVDLFMNLVPFYLIGFSLLYVYISYTVSRNILIRLGEKIDGLATFHKWRLPKFVVFIYLVTIGFNLIFINEYYSFWSMILINLLPLLTVAIIIQAYSLIFFIAYEKKWSKWLAYSSLIFSIITPFTIILILLGVLDILVPIRERMLKK